VLTETGFLILLIATSIVVPAAVLDRKAPEITIVLVEGCVTVVPETSVVLSLTTVSTVKELPA